MTCTVIHLRSGPQTGKTTLALGALERMDRYGIPVAYIVPTSNHAREAMRRTNVPCFSWFAVVNAPQLPFRALAVEREVMPDVMWDVGVRNLRALLEAHEGPSQLILIEATE